MKPTWSTNAAHDITVGLLLENCLTSPHYTRPHHRSPVIALSSRSVVDDGSAEGARVDHAHHVCVRFIDCLAHVALWEVQPEPIERE